MSTEQKSDKSIQENITTTGSIVQPRDVERLVAISGATPAGRPKAHVLLNYYLQYSDGSTKEIQMLTMDKPIVNIFKHAGFVNVFLDFGSRMDMDLRMMWDTLTEYSRPTNSVSYLPEELEAGYYETPEGPQMVYFPVLDLALSPIGKEDAFMVHSYNPAFFTLAPNAPDGDACVIQFTFLEETFAVVDDLAPVDHAHIQSEIQEELEAEKRGYYAGQ